MFQGPADVSFERRYTTQTRRETIGDLCFDLLCIENLDREIDAMFRELELRGSPEILTELCPFFGVVWPAGRALATFLADRERHRLVGRKVIEIGCGLALPGLVAARRGADVTLSDAHPDVANFLRANETLNNLPPFRFMNADWKRDQCFDDTRFEVILGSDVVYDRLHPRSLACFIDRHLLAGGECLIADPGRIYFDDFILEMTRLGFTHWIDVVEECFVARFAR